MAIPSVTQLTLGLQSLGRVGFLCANVFLRAMQPDVVRGPGCTLIVESSRYAATRTQTVSCDSFRS